MNRIKYGLLKWLMNDADPNVGTWIPASERLPEVGGSYIVHTATGHVTTSHWYPPNAKTGFSGYFAPRNRIITHWMPLPTPPKGE